MDNLYNMIQKADAGDPEAQFKVAEYITFSDPSEDVEQDWAERAIEYCKRAADQGISDALVSLGTVFLEALSKKAEEDGVGVGL